MSDRVRKAIGLILLLTGLLLRRFATGLYHG